MSETSAVAVFKDGSIVGHVLINMAPILYQFLRREVNKAFVEVEGEKVNRGGHGYGLEIPCVYRFYGPPWYIQRLKDALEPLIAAGHL